MVKVDGFRLESNILGIIGTCFKIYIYMSPDTTVKTAGHVATSASNILKEQVHWLTLDTEKKSKEKIYRKATRRIYK